MSIRRRRRYYMVFTTLGVLAGFFIGLGLFTFSYAGGSAYFRSDPKVCVNCHIMQDYLDSWQMSSHRHVSDCNRCHTPPDVIGKYTTKAIHGIRHSWAFTTGYFTEPIQIKADSLAVVEANCRNCHRSLFHGSDTVVLSQDQGRCTSCHRDVAHMR